MTSTEIIKKLFIAFSKRDEDEFYRLAEELIELEKRKKHNIVAKELKEALYTRGQINNHYKRYRPTLPIPRDNDSGFPLLEIKEYHFSWDQLILSEKNKYVLELIVNELKSSEILATYNLSPVRKVLFCGEPGTGKTFTAQVLSSVLQLPMVYVRFDAIISSYLGETATNLRKVFDFIKNGVWVVLFDEVDIIGKNRNDHHESGEIKRVVNNFLQMLDNFEGDSLLLAATNHPHILDPAVWRRFDEVINFELPNADERYQLLNLFLKPIKKEAEIDLTLLSTKTEGFTPSDLKTMCKEAMKHAIVSGRDKLSSIDLDFAYSRFVSRFAVRKDKESKL
ncbi:ATP-binding protein [Geobacillus thermodenitrificans]|uniref:AAA family ATPase n=1 Tax=Geobacillus thermodenitrificans TaxID=33940 RepID=UPI000C28DE4B|nr:ATP-binding protein [Geobacillus thermodenitrificans]PJW19279.1 ATP-binding protein [Geobacillus thermodenitrificans]